MDEVNGAINSVENEDDALDSSLGSYIYDMLATIEDEFRDGSSQRLRDDTFMIGIRSIFEIDEDKLDDIEEIISSKHPKYTEAYETIKNTMRNLFDKYYGITFSDDVDLERLHDVYIAIYVQYFDLLAKYAAGTDRITRGSDTTFGEAIGNARKLARKRSTSYSRILIGDLIADENEFILEKIAHALAAVDPGNAVYEYIFGQLPDAIDLSDPNAVENLLDTPKVDIEIEAFRRRMLMEFEYEGEEINHQTFDLVLLEYADQVDR